MVPVSQLKLFGKKVRFSLGRRGGFSFRFGGVSRDHTKKMGIGEDFKRSIFQQYIYSIYVYIYIQQLAICIYIYYIYNCVAKHQRFELCNVLYGSLW